MKIPPTTKRALLAVGSLLLCCSAPAEETTVTNTAAESLSSKAELTLSSHDERAPRLGLGASIGEPTGVSVKYFFSDTFAIDGGLGWSFRDETDPHIHADALWHVNHLFDTPDGEVSLYFGVGGRVKFRDHADDLVGLRFPIGLSYRFDRAPVDLFVEVAPIFDFTPDDDWSFSALVGARYWF